MYVMHSVYYTFSNNNFFATVADAAADAYGLGGSEYYYHSNMHRYRFQKNPQYKRSPH